MNHSHSKEVENQTLSTFRKHRPSEYFSHLDSSDAFKLHDQKVENLYRFGLCMPPEFFAGKSLIDLGSGTGEHTVSLARWGAHCTLVEMNDEALSRARDVFSRATSNIDSHKFINSSLYDIDIDGLAGSYDISHSRGVFTHVSNKDLAFNILCKLAKPGGYVIYGDRNSSGGIQEMLQRYAIYRLGGASDSEITDTAEALFSDDIDRSQNSVPRTREAIIFDRWVIQQQDDPSAEDVLNMFKKEGISYVSSWPKIDYAGRGLSTFTDPNQDSCLSEGASLAENLWMILQNGEDEKVYLQGFSDFNSYKIELGKTASMLRNLQYTSQISSSSITTQFNILREQIIRSSSCRSPLLDRLETFVSEVSDFLGRVDSKEDLATLRISIDNYKHLFKGYAGVRHVDYVGYKNP